MLCETATTSLTVGLDAPRYFNQLSEEEDCDLMDIILDTYDSDNEPQGMEPFFGCQQMQKSCLLSGFGMDYVPKPRAHSLEEPLKPLKSEDFENQLNRINKEMEALRADPVHLINTKTVAKKCKKNVTVSRPQADKSLTPKFIRDELKRANGTGEFTKPELLITLFYAYKYFDNTNAYSKVRACMSNVRSRASIRRKIEKIVAQERGISGGLLLKKEKREEYKRVILDRFWKVIQSIGKKDELKVQSFAVQMKQYCESEKVLPIA